MTYTTTISKRNRLWFGIGCSFILILNACNGLTNKVGSGDPQLAYAQDRQLARNGGFEEGGPVPQSWTRDLKRTGNEGAVSLDHNRFHSGHASLKLEPNSKNVAENPLAVTQMIPAGEYRGQKVEFSGYMLSDGSTNAILGMMSLVRGVPQGPPDMLFHNGGSSTDWVEQRKTYTVPDDPSVQLLLICMSNGKSGASWFDDVSVIPVSAASDHQAVADEAPLKAVVNVDASKIVRAIPRTLYGANIEWRWDGLHLWREKERSLDPKLIGLTKDLGVSVLRYPGGIFSDFYHWKSGVGPLDSRPEMRHEADNQDKSHPYFGTDEALTFAKDIGGELWITANAGTGTAQEAGDWVKYVNGQSRRVRFWEVGNELYIKNNSPNFSTITVDPAAYAKRFGEFARAMRAADPGIKIAAIGGENQGRYAFVNYPDWLKTVLTAQADQIDFISVHDGYAPLPADSDSDFRAVYSAMLAAPTLIGRNLQAVSSIIDKYAPARASQIKIAVTEWGPAFRFDLNSKWVDHPKTLGSALFSASALKVLIESPKVEVATFLMLHDFAVYGAIGSRNTDFPANHDWEPTARYYAFQLYTKHFGEQLLSSTTEVPTFDSPAIGATDAVTGAPYLDIISSLSADGKQLYIIGINKHFDQPIDATIKVNGFAYSTKATAWTLNGSSMDANTGTGVIRVPGLNVPRQMEDPQNPRFYKGGPEEITFASAEFTAAGPELTYRFPAHSATSIVLTRK